jgi:hypothetical protein
MNSTGYSAGGVVHRTLEFVIDAVVKKCTVSQVDSNVEKYRVPMPIRSDIRAQRAGLG